MRQRLAKNPAGLFATQTLRGHLIRGAVALALLYMATGQQHVHPGWSVLAGLLALVAMRGCPACWTIGLIEAVRQRLQERASRRRTLRRRRIRSHTHPGRRRTLRSSGHAQVSVTLGDYVARTALDGSVSPCREPGALSRICRHAEQPSQQQRPAGGFWQSCQVQSTGEIRLTDAHCNAALRAEAQCAGGLRGTAGDAVVAGAAIEEDRFGEGESARRRGVDQHAVVGDRQSAVAETPDELAVGAKPGWESGPSECCR